MYWTRFLASLALATAAFGCTTSHGQTYRSEDWQAGRSLGRVLVIVPPLRTDSGESRPARDEKVRSAIRAALAGFPGTTVIDAGETPNLTEEERPISEARAIALARELDAQSVCLVTLGQFGGRYLVTLLPPGWDSRTTVQYAMRLIDVKSGAVLLDSVRERTSGGYFAIMTATYPADLTADLGDVLSAGR